MSLTAIMPGSRRVGSFRVPPVDSKIGISTPNHEPVDGVGGNESTDFTSEFLERCHGLCSNSGSFLRTLPDAVVGPQAVFIVSLFSHATLALPGGGKIGIYEPKHPSPLKLQGAGIFYGIITVNDRDHPCYNPREVIQ